MAGAASVPDGRVPAVDGERCVHAHSPCATCRACVDACPRGAFVLDDEVLGLRESACDGCGLCRPACPESAIALALDPLLRADARGRLVLFAACELSGWAQAGRIPCVHALTRADIEQWQRRGLAEIILHTGDCAACSRGQGGRAERLIGDYNRWRHSRGVRPIEARLVTAQAWRAALDRYPDPAERVDPARRRLLSVFQAAERPAGRGESERGAGWLHDHRPRLDAAKCNGCDACLNVCPHGCLRLQRGAEGLAYAIDPLDCTGCGLCRDVCEVEAVAIDGQGLREPRDVPLREGRCRKCGVPFHQPAQAAGTRDVCRICARNDPTSRLFQVYD